MRRYNTYSMDAVPASRSLPGVQDILYCIFSHLDPDRSFGKDVVLVRQALIRSALTCRNFTRPALNTLWKSLPSGEPLIALLCTLGIAEGRTFEVRAMTPPWENPDPPISTSYSLSTPKDPRMHPNWTRFRDYATRVRNIHLVLSGDPFETTWPIWVEFSEFMFNDPILPFLQSADLATEGVCSLHTAPLCLVSPSTREMTIRFVGPATDELFEPDRFLSEVCTRAPNLQIIVLNISPWICDLSILHRNPHLRSVIVRTLLPVDSLEPLTHLEALEQLTVFLERESNTRITLPFARLHHLSVWASYGWDSARDLLEWVQAPQLRSMSLWEHQRDPQQLIREATPCLQTIATRFSTLETLSVHCDKSIRSPFTLPGEALNTKGALGAILKPLLPLRYLRHVTLDFKAFIFRIASDDMCGLAEAWPDIEELLINVATVDGGRAGFESVAHFARCCPHLHALRLPAMDLAIGASDKLEYPAEPHPLRDLDVKDVVFNPREADLSGEMTAFIQRVFPRAAVPFVKHPIFVTGEESGDRSRLV